MKHFSLLLFLLLLASCSTDSPMNPNESNLENSPTETSKSIMLSKEKVAQIALDGAASFRDNKSRASLSVKGDILAISSPNAARSVQDTAFYVVNFENDMGYAIVSPYAVRDPLIAVIDEGSFNPEDLNKDTPFAGYIKEISSKSIEIRDSLVAKPIFPYEMDSIQYTVTTKVNYPPKAKQFWGQASPFGDFCPNDLCGCVSLSCIFAMQFYRYPTSLELTYPNHPVSNVNLDWEVIRTHGKTPKSIAAICQNCGIDEEHHTMMRYLGREIAERLESRFYFGLTVSTLEKAHELMASLGFQISEINTLSFNHNFSLNIYNNIYIVGGYSDNSIGHCFVIDGQKTTHHESRFFISKDGGFTWQPNHQFDSTWDTTYVHVNWGFNGDNNGYFSFPNHMKCDDLDPDAENAYSNVWDSIRGFCVYGKTGN